LIANELNWKFILPMSLSTTDTKWKTRFDSKEIAYFSFLTEWYTYVVTNVGQTM